MNWSREGGLRIPAVARCRWLPMWLRVRCTGKWTQAEVDATYRRAREEYERYRQFWSEEGDQ